MALLRGEEHWRNIGFFGENGMTRKRRRPGGCPRCGAGYWRIVDAKGRVSHSCSACGHVPGPPAHCLAELRAEAERREPRPVLSALDERNIKTLVSG